MSADQKERAADHLDQATQTTEFLVASRTQEASDRSLPEQTQNEDGTWPHIECVDCGVDIPAGRLALGKVRCIACQSVKEKRANGYFIFNE